MESIKSQLITDLSAHGRVRFFVRLGFKTGDLFLHTGVGERLFQGQKWHGLGMLGKVSEIPAGENNNTNRIRLTLNTTDTAVLGEIAQNDPIGRECEIYLMTLDEQYRVSNSQVLESGYIVSNEVERGDISQITLSVAGESERWKQARLNQRWNHATQSALFADDKFFSEHAATSQNLHDTQPGNYIGNRGNRYEP
ncbi:hypothetical protein [Pseudoalteromonas denitrificans]|uniref:Uncharacterized protein n=1 Tax=Pseudoalteromonas denitrificans DSM 6059 TaxID=1123010 RepID=A0A1I1TIR0_9GAMM|nr:hypothetical protein [Pseudoalteromonas denitrificans]SFD55370.1 hypothetical protein SAMN02745724_04835 [Pseudoalteromonas denitrificans DSM 6059]